MLWILSLQNMSDYVLSMVKGQWLNNRWDFYFFNLVMKSSDATWCQNLGHSECLNSLGHRLRCRSVSLRLGCRSVSHQLGELFSQSFRFARQSICCTGQAGILNLEKYCKSVDQANRSEQLYQWLTMQRPMRLLARAGWRGLRKNRVIGITVCGLGATGALLQISWGFWVEYIKRRHITYQ